MPKKVTRLLDSQGESIAKKYSRKELSFDEWFSRVTDLSKGGISIPRGKARVIYESLKHGDPVLFTGEPGTGKTKLAEKIAETEESCFVFIPPLGGDATRELFGRWDTGKQLLNIELARANPSDKEAMQKARNTFSPENYLTGLLAEGLAKGCTVLIDEINRYDTKMQNMLLHVSDKKRIFIPNLGEIEPCLGELPEEKCGFRMIATANENDVGTRPISSALLRRFIEVPFENPSPEKQREILLRMFGEGCSVVVDEVIDTAERIKDEVAQSPPLSSVVRAVRLLKDMNKGTCPIRVEPEVMASLLTQNSDDFVEALEVIGEEE